MTVHLSRVMGRCDDLADITVGEPPYQPDTAHLEFGDAVTMFVPLDGLSDRLRQLADVAMRLEIAAEGAASRWASTSCSGSR